MLFDNFENIKLIVKLLKENNFRNIVINPGGTNRSFVSLVQNDSFFNCYSIVDERSAVYFSIGLYLQLKQPIVLSCTAAQATRNYIPGLTEAFYKKIPLLAITMQKHPRFTYQSYMQAPDQTSLPADSVKKSFQLPYLTNINDVFHSIRVANEAIIELTRNGKGPVQLSVPWLDFPLNESIPPKFRVFKTYKNNFEDINIVDKRILIVIGEHSSFSNEEIEAIETFTTNSNSVIYTNHLSNFHGKFSLKANLLLSTSTPDDLSPLKPDIIISIGGQTGDYPLYLFLSSQTLQETEHWRVSEDDKIVDTYDKLTKSFVCTITQFFSVIKGVPKNHDFFNLWKEKLSTLNTDTNLPFSGVAVAQYLHKKIPRNSIIQLSILHSLRTWELFSLDESIECFSNVAAFGIDGGLSTLIGQSVATNRNAYMIIGDLAFLYDMNSLAIRHIKNNLKIILINNNGGMEFKLQKEDNSKIDKFTAAANHFKNAKGWALTCGFDYYSANSLEELDSFSEAIIGLGSKPVLVEIFVNDIDERNAYNMLLEINKPLNLKRSIKRAFKSITNIFGG